MNINSEPEYIHELYGTTPGKASFANNCLLARKLVEKGVRYVQLFDWGWDTHGTDADLSIDIGLRNKCREIDRPMTALIMDLKQRGLLEETLVVWGGEFGRQPTAEYGVGTGRDHNPYGFTMWMAGGGLKGGVSVGTTDELGSKAVDSPFHVKRLHATVLKQLGLDPNTLSYFFRGLDQKL